MKRHILIVEDNKMNRMLLAKVLDVEYAVTEAQTGEEALSILTESEIDFSAIVLDMLLPGIDGYAVLKQIRSNSDYQETPVIVASSLNDQDSYEKALELGANGYVTKPFKSVVLLHTLRNTIKLHETATKMAILQRDTLTGLMTREMFLVEAEELIRNKDPGYYSVACINIEHFKVINDQYGLENGDKVLRHIARILSRSASHMEGICCRSTADKFAILYPQNKGDSFEVKQSYAEATKLGFLNRDIHIRIGKYNITDPQLPVHTMMDRAALAENSIKGKFNTYIVEYNDAMRTELLHEQQIVSEMNEALEKGQFEPWYQPQYDHATGAIIGAEALVRWRKDGDLIPPYIFIPVFERNGFIYQMDQYISSQSATIAACSIFRWTRP